MHNEMDRTVPLEMAHVTFQHCGWVPEQIDWKMPEHVHAKFHEMILVVRGRIETRFTRQTLIGKKGDVLWYPQGMPHAERALDGELFQILFVSFMTEKSMPPDAPLMVFDRDGRIEQQLRWIADLFPPKTDEERRLLNFLMFAAFFEHRRLAKNPASSDVVMRIKRYVRTHIAEALTLDDLAAQAGLSRFYFSRSFRSETGMTPMDFVRRLRIEAAEALILRTPLPLKAIATQVGFCDEYHFSRVFRKETGMPPSSLRRGRA